VNTREAAFITALPFLGLGHRPLVIAEGENVIDGLGRLWGYFSKRLF
jgi:hypothetical protein